MHTQFSKNNAATSGAVTLSVQGMNYTNLENLSTIVKIPVKPRYVWGRPNTKSIVTSSKGLAGTLRGYNSPNGRYVDTQRA